jgi:hypothetical protein
MFKHILLFITNTIVIGLKPKGLSRARSASTIYTSWCGDADCSANIIAHINLCIVLIQTTHKKTLFYMEQMILKHKAHVNTVGIKPVVGGIDFFFAQKQGAKKLVDFLQSIVPCR